MLSSIGREYIESLGKGSSEICNRKTDQVLKDLKIYGTSEKKISTISFLLEGIHQYDTGMILDKLGIAVRTGTHCAQPVMARYGIEGTVRASMCFYNTKKRLIHLWPELKK